MKITEASGAWQKLLNTRVDRRTLGKAVISGILGTALTPIASRLQTGSSERTVFAEEDPIKNVKINEASTYTWIHPMSNNGEVWSYGFEVRDPALYGQQRSISDNGVVGEMFLNGAKDVGLDLRTDITHLADYKGQGERAALWLTTRPKDQLLLMNEDNDSLPTPVAAVTADDKGFAGILVPDQNVQFGIRVVRASGQTNPVRVAFGNISKEDFADPSKHFNPHVIDAEKFIGASAPSEQASQAQPSAPKQELPPSSTQPPEFLQQPVISTFQDASRNTFFLAQSSSGIGWSHFAEFSLPDARNGVFYRDNGNVGEVFIQTRGLSQSDSSNLDLTMRINPLFTNDYKMSFDGNPTSNNRPAMWIKTQPGALIQLCGADGSVITFIDNGRVFPVQAQADSAGFGGLVLPEYQAIIRARVVLPFVEMDTDTQIQFGPEKPQDKGKPSTIDSNNWIPRQN